MKGYTHELALIPFGYTHELALIPFGTRQGFCVGDR